MNSLDDRRQYFDQLASKRSRDARRHAVLYRDRIRWLKSLIPEDASVIDLGCGIGTVLSALPQAHKVGIDFSEKMIEKAKADTSSTYDVDTVGALHHSQKHEYVLLLDTINYVPDVQIALEDIRKKLCEDRTRLVITTFNFLWSPIFKVGEWLHIKTRFPAQNWLSYHALENMLSLAGFEVVEHSGRILCPVSIPLIAGFFNRFIATLPVFQRLCMIQTIIARPIPLQHPEHSVTVLSAVRNEKGNVRQIINAMPQFGTKTELLFIEGHSNDGTWEEIQQAILEYNGPLTIRGLKQPGRGKGDALHHGIRESTGDVLVIYDGDYTVHPSELPKLYHALVAGKAECVNASRLMYPMRGEAMPALNLLGNKIFSMMFSWLFGQKIVDVLSPVKAFYRSDYPRMTTRMDPFGDFDVFLGVARQHRKIRETPVHYMERSYGTTKLSPFGHGWLLTKMFFKGARIIKWS